MANETLPGTATQNDNGKRKRLLLILIAACVVVAILYTCYWLFIARYKVSTDNAYVQGNVVQITPQVGGTVIAVDADDTDYVKAGQVLVRLDPVDARVALDQAEAQLANTVREVRGTFSTNASLQTDVNTRAADLARREPLVATGAVSKEELLHMQNALTDARERLAQNQALIEGTSPENNPRVLAAAAHAREAYLAWKRSGIAAPIDGTVARRSVQVGQRVQAGVPLMAVVPMNELWVDANFKESQLEDLRVGQPVSLTADVYGSHLEYKGHVVGLGAGTGAAFSLLPAQNATGNWIKIVQRLPVRIALDPEALQKHPLRIGLSMNVEVDVHDQSGKSVTDGSTNQAVVETKVYDALGAEADAHVNKIVSANLGHKVTLPVAQ
ncbi:MAG TPA: HlyD family efflux transporter periplasmic adaptor subunit [Rhodocyclaceae bacterium]|nr:HlyD family efflux transporter periplasmic adaptor subunit [Rhodocyclaceae bacterium]